MVEEERRLRTTVGGLPPRGGLGRERFCATGELGLEPKNVAEERRLRGTVGELLPEGGLERRPPEAVAFSLPLLEAEMLALPLLPEGGKNIVELAVVGGGISWSVSGLPSTPLLSTDVTDLLGVRVC
jgi:hypothetical protein